MNEDSSGEPGVPRRPRAKRNVDISRDPNKPKIRIPIRKQVNDPESRPKPRTTVQLDPVTDQTPRAKKAKQHVRDDSIETLPNRNCSQPIHMKQMYSSFVQSKEPLQSVREQNPLPANVECITIRKKPERSRKSAETVEPSTSRHKKTRAIEDMPDIFEQEPPRKRCSRFDTADMPTRTEPPVVSRDGLRPREAVPRLEQQPCTSKRWWPRLDLDEPSNATEDTIKSRLRSLGEKSSREEDPKVDMEVEYFPPWMSTSYWTLRGQDIRKVAPLLSPLHSPRSGSPEIQDSQTEASFCTPKPSMEDLFGDLDSDMEDNAAIQFNKSQENMTESVDKELEQGHLRLTISRIENPKPCNMVCEAMTPASFLTQPQEQSSLVKIPPELPICKNTIPEIFDLESVYLQCAASSHHPLTNNEDDLSSDGSSSATEKANQIPCKQNNILPFINHTSAVSHQYNTSFTVEMQETSFKSQQPERSSISGKKPSRDDHPLTRHYRVRDLWSNLDPAAFTTDVPVEVYQVLPDTMYMDPTFTKTLFPKVAHLLTEPQVTDKIPIIELGRIDDIVRLRKESEAKLNELLRLLSQSELPPRVDFQEASPGPTTCVLPPTHASGYHPVLFRVVKRNHGSSILLECVYFELAYGRPDLRIIALDKFGFNLVTEQHGLSLGQLFVNDLVYVYALEPTVSALKCPQKVFEKCKSGEILTLSNSLQPFFRAKSYAVAKTCDDYEMAWAVVVHTYTSSARDKRVVQAKIAIEGVSDPVQISANLCQFDIKTISKGDLLAVKMRTMRSTAQRFIEPPASSEDETILLKSISGLVPALCTETLSLVLVMKATPGMLEFLKDRFGQFVEYQRNTDNMLNMSQKLFRVGAAGMIGSEVYEEDRSLHLCKVSCTKMDEYPLKLTAQLPNFHRQRGWIPGRVLALFCPTSNLACHCVISSSFLDDQHNTLNIAMKLTDIGRSAVKEVLRKTGQKNGNAVEASVLLRLTTKNRQYSDPSFEPILRGNIFPPPAKSQYEKAVNFLYQQRNHTSRTTERMLGTEPLNINITEGDRDKTSTSVCYQKTEYFLTRCQKNAIAALNVMDSPYVVVNAPFGTGKTLLAAYAAAVSAIDQTAVMVAPTNSAVLQLAQCVQGFHDVQMVRLLRYVSDGATTATTGGRHTFDLEERLKTLHERFDNTICTAERRLLQEYRSSLRIIEAYLDSNVHTMEETRKFLLIERILPEKTRTVMDILLKYEKPNIICLTVASAIRAFRPGGIFHSVSSKITRLHIDEASQVSEPAALLLMSCFPDAKTVVYGDIKQLRPYTKMGVSPLIVNAASTGIMEVAMQSKICPIVPLVECFRCHPAIMNIPNCLFYHGTLKSSVRSDERSILTKLLSKPRDPLLYIATSGKSTKTSNQSHENKSEERTAKEIVEFLLDQNISPASIAIVGVYTPTVQNLSEWAKQKNVTVRTIDSVQGTEYEIVLLLTTRTDFDRGSAFFLDEKGRINVAVSRAKSGLIVLGHEESLKKTEYWWKVIQMICATGMEAADKNWKTLLRK